MRRLLVIAVSALALAGVLLPATPVGGQVTDRTVLTPRQLIERFGDERLGMVFDGLRRRAGGPCGEAFEIVEAFTAGLIRCTHGPDPAPDGVDVRIHREFGAADASEASTPQPGVAMAQAGIPCYGTGSDGYRVQLLYVRLAGSTDKSTSLYPTFVESAARVNASFNDSAAETGGVRNVRFVTDGSCNLVIEKVEVSSSALSTFSRFVSELKSKGYNRSDRKYLSWVDANTYCGISEVYSDDKPASTPGLSTSNHSNGHPQVAGAFARVDNGCWAQSAPVEAHELAHLLGGVQRTAPNATSNFHCRDESDRMCYVDGAGVTLVQRCAGSHERLLDCNGDDYFNTNPATGSWLATHWNVANSAFLANAAPGAPPPPQPPPPTTTTTTTTTRPPAASTTTTTTRPPTTTTTRPPATATTTTTTATGAPPPPTTVAPLAPSAPRSLLAFRAGSGIRLRWSPPTAGPVTGYNVYRRTGSGPFSKVADLGRTTNYTDATAAAGVAYTYAVAAENGSLEGPLSNQSTATR